MANICSAGYSAPSTSGKRHIVCSSVRRRAGEEALALLGVSPEEIADAVEDFRRRDAVRFEANLVGGLYAGRELLRGNRSEDGAVQS